MTQPEIMEAAVHEYVRALNACDLEAIVALYASDATVEDPVGSEPRRGAEAIRAFYATVVAMKLTVALEGQIRAAAGEAAFPFSVKVNQNGQAMTIRPIDVFRFNEAGKITSMRAFFGAANMSVDGG